jgi:NADPH2:quinone reductase
MSAITLDDFGAAPALRELPIPEPGPGEVLVHIEASSVNGFDLAVVAGWLKGMMEYRFPVVLGKDFAGTVAAIGADVTRFAVGDAVFGVVMKPVLGDGSFGEYVAVPENFGITRLPAALDMTFAGALGLAGTAALMAVDAVAPAPGETVLIAGATGGVGAYAVQLAAARGAEVIATSQSGEDAAFVRGLGAALTVDYSTDLAAALRYERPRGVDAVIHLAGDALQLADLLVPGGRLASTLGIGPDQFAGRPVTATSIMATPDATRLDELAAAAVSGRLQSTVRRTYRLEQVPQAFTDFAAGTLGKLAISGGLS